MQLEEFRKRKAAEQANAAAAPQLSQATEQTRVPEERLNALVPAIPIPVAPTAPSAKPPEATATLDTPAPQPHAHDMHNLNLLSGKVSGIEIEQSLHLAAAPAPAAPPSEPSSWLAHPTPHHATTTTESSISGATSSTAWTVVQNPSFHETPALLKVQERSASALAPMWRGAHEAQPWEPGAAFPEAKPAWMSDHPPQSGAERNDFPSVNVSEGLTAGLDGDDMGSAGLASVDAASAEARDTSEHESGRENDPGSESTKPRSLIDHSDRASSAVSIPPGPMPK